MRAKLCDIIFNYVVQFRQIIRQKYLLDNLCCAT